MRRQERRRPKFQKRVIAVVDNSPAEFNTFSAVGDIVEDAGMRYALELHPWRIMSNADSMLRLIEHVDSKALGMNFDPSHLFPMGETPALAILKLRGRIFHTHISDNDASSNVHWRPGKGKIDWVSVLKALKAIGYDYVLSVELEDVQGVSRPGEGDAEPVYDAELIKAAEFLKATGKEAGVEVE
jgi:sugar phosphate isomerase/epimerase